MYIGAGGGAEEVEAEAEDGAGDVTELAPGAMLSDGGDGNAIVVAVIVGAVGKVLLTSPLC